MYLQGPRQRVEFPGVVSIDQCDLKRSVMLNAAEKKYRVQPYPETPASAAPAPAQDPTGQPPRGGVVTMTTTLTDTLERQPMFGLEARHVKSMIVKESSQRACDKAPLKIEMDAWYVDLPEQSICVRSAAQPPPRPVDPSACTDRTETRTVGDVKLGFPVKLTTTTTTGEGDKVETMTSSQAVTELEITRLDKALFEVPADYVEANSTAEIVPALGSGGLADALFGSTADGTSTATPKKAGVIRIGVLEPVNHTDQNLSGRALRQDVVAKFKGSFDALPLAGSSPAEIEKEAARLECDYILLTDITEVKTSKSGGIGGALKKVSGGGDKDKHEVKLDYKLFPVGATQSPKFTGKVSASTRRIWRRIGTEARRVCRADVSGRHGRRRHDERHDGHGRGHGRDGRRTVRSARVRNDLDGREPRRVGRRHGQRRSVRARHARHGRRSAEQRRQGDDGPSE